MDTITDWIGALVAIVAAAVALGSAIDARRTAKRAETAAAIRATGRVRVGQVIDAGNALMEEMRAWVKMGRPSGLRATLAVRYQAWEHDAFAAVKGTDEAHVGRFTRPLRGPHMDHHLQERLDRLSEILDRLQPG